MLNNYFILPSAQQGGGGGGGGGILVSTRPSVRPAFGVRSVTATVLDECFPYYAQMITNIRECVVHNDL